jgi:hypothetical protein
MEEPSVEEDIKEYYIVTNPRYSCGSWMRGRRRDTEGYVG